MKYTPNKKKDEREVGDLKKQSFETTAQTASGIKFGGSISAYCSGCGKQHTIPYIPGKYRICDTTEKDHGSRNTLFGGIKLTDVLVTFNTYILINQDGTISYEKKESSRQVTRY